MVNEPSVDETISILRGLKERFETYHGVRIHDNAIVAAANLSNRYISDRFLPDKAIDLVDEASANIKTELASVPSELDTLNRKVIQLEIEKSALSKEKDDKSKERLQEAEKELQDLKDKQNKLSVNNLKSKIEQLKSDLEIAQNNADYKRAGEIQYSLLPDVQRKLEESEKKIDNKLISEEVTENDIAEIVGPTGVGKTEVARTLAEILFKSSKKMVRIDMSEYMEKHSVSKLIGSPPGYVGYEEGGRLTEAVRRNPYSIVLFDEIEKAHPDVFNILLQVLDEGRITDSLGKTVDFKIQLFTDGKVDEQIIQKELLKYFKPEFLNRIDNIITFNFLDKSVIKQIVDRILSELSTRLEQNDFLVSFNDASRHKICEEGFEKQFGARPIKRYIEKNIESLLATNIINGTFEVNKHYVVEVDNPK
ncbi:hypothetical protein FQA39_LY12931 [Lamprigera yunnana]|nr:hypothetical protein FQA39_LY12931 [Lamprigera yunnana]